MFLKRPYIFLWFFLCVASQAFGEEYTFELDELEKKPYHGGGYLEFKPSVFGLDKDAALYQLKFYDLDKGHRVEEIASTLQLEGSLEKGIARLFARADFALDHSYLGWSDEGNLYEAFLSLKPDHSMNLIFGKQTMKWGKGYAWNPAAFVDRPKDPDDPELNLEGFIAASGNFTRTFDGPLKTFSFTPVLLPSYGDMNDDFGETGKLNVAAKLYFLYYDTDIDFMFLSKGSRTARYGFDFSRNLLANLEVHGEFAWITDFKKNVVDEAGDLSSTQSDVISFLVGLRYLSTRETTTIFEYYRNGTGFDQNEMEDFFSFLHFAHDSYVRTRNSGLLNKARNLSERGYARPNAMKDYLYLRVSQKEPFDILYFTPSVTCIFNVDDRSFSVSPELLYTGITNLELRLKAAVLAGDDLSDYGEKQNDYRVELRARYYF